MTPRTSVIIPCYNVQEYLSEALTRLPGVGLVPNLPDLRDEIARQQVVVLPLISGGGIKNKLLEAGGMARAVVCSPRACRGLRDTGQLPVVQARRPGEWVHAIRSLWADPQRQRHLGVWARSWVQAAHTWEAAARIAVAGLQGSAGWKQK